MSEGYPSRNTETGGLLRYQFVKTPRPSRWYEMHTDKKDSDRFTVCSWFLELAKLNSAFSRVARCSLPSAPASRTISQDTLRHWEHSFREQSVMCNQAAELSRCLVKVQDSKVTHLKTLHTDKRKVKASERMQQAVEELEYLVTFNQSISQAMQRTMQDWSEGIFISMANLTLACRDSYLEYLRGGMKQDTLIALRAALVDLTSLFPDQLLVKAEDGIFRSEERRSSGSSQRKPGRFIRILPQLQSQHINWTGSPLYPLGSRSGTGNRERKDVASPQHSNRNRLRVPSRVNDNYCVQSVAGLKDSVYVSGKLQGLNLSPVIAG